MGDAVLGSMRLSADCLYDDCLYDEIAWKKYKRETIDDRHEIGHCSFKLCQDCFADKYSHNCCLDANDSRSLIYSSNEDDDNMHKINQKILNAL